jgi:hypothetical protein
MRKILMGAFLLLGAASQVQAQTCNANFNISQSSVVVPPFQANFTNTSTFVPVSPTDWASGYVSFGDGSSPVWNTPGSSLTHNYPSPGTYFVWLSHEVVDSITNQVICIDTFSQSITITQNPSGANSIAGDIHWDQSTIPDSVAYFKVWLIQHDSTANTLTAVDSVIVYPWTGSYVFNNAASGGYLTKAAPSYGNAPIPAYGFVPTYHDSSLYWSGASTIVHTGGVTYGKDIWMLYGTPTTGPGFIGGNISMGAGKGTGTGVPHMLVFLRNNTNNKMIASVYTNANGDYTFNNIPSGSYNIYPEEMNYVTTPSATLNVTTGQTSTTGVDFVQTDDEIKPATVLGIPAISKNDGISLYPNPVTDQLFIENKTGLFNQFTIVNMLGQMIKQGGLKQGNNKIETTSFGSGIYYIIVHGADGSRSMKVTKK